MMPAPIIIIGSGFAAYQLVKTLRRTDSRLSIQVFTSDEGNEYNKPDLSHAFSKQQSVEALIQLPAAEFAKRYQLELFANTKVENVDTTKQTITANGQLYPYSKLVFATGASTFVPEIKGNNATSIITLNSLVEYRQAQASINASSSVLIMGGGLIGVELAMDLRTNGKEVIIVEPNSRLLANVAPDFVALRLEQQLHEAGITLALYDSVMSLNTTEGEAITTVTSKQGKTFKVDTVISAAGLRANSLLATQAGIAVNRGIVVNKQLATSAKNVYAIGDCAEIDGKVMAYLQPIILSANVLAKQLLDQPAQLALTPMMVKVKTPAYPIQLGGSFDADSTWKVGFEKQGLVAEAYNAQHQMTGFVVTDQQLNQAFPLLRKISGQ
ncbi:MULTISPECIES: NADH:flavorubredoxin reductase NorW [unclassified Agarivorans]|uniref:NADH:flavorubredoxin reductase NorW n=1 Tax=unclassified Agarivorans TaxID=2636026 RepID=UPI0026E228D4|nr:MULTISPECIES: NADH:flavorubredoxin reductase NorW [unclassified Agarivorans]MDO6683883.1 NADH:flavorubredoxin reductase NorW [Agarivorans sp. 3_MG-2023]MDO6714384.1 NADH:flavorubredoxin reductase NorW [Agarivorans sp. 2_MG-2023]